MKSEMKQILLAGVKCMVPAFLLLNLLAMILVLVNLIPNSAIYDNLCKSIDYYKSMESFTKTGAEPGADLNQLNIIMQVDSKHPVKSMLLDSIYGKTGQFMDDQNGYESILERKEADHEYSRYWHGSQILWRPLLVAFTTRQVMIILCCVYSVLLLVLCIKMRECAGLLFPICFLAVNVIYIIPDVFRVLNFIPLFFIILLALYLLCFEHIDPLFVFCIIGIATSFFDFLTVETLTLSIPLLFIICKHWSKGKLQVIECIKYSAGWLFWYCLTYVYKWFLVSITEHKNYFSIAISEATKYPCTFGKLMSIKANVNALMFGKVSYNTSFNILLGIFVIAALAVYLFRKQGSEKYLCCIFAVCLIPYLRYFVLSGHSWEHAYFEFRAQLVVLLALPLLFQCAIHGICKKE